MGNVQKRNNCRLNIYVFMYTLDLQWIDWVQKLISN
jgi:hypothetical protein